MKKPTFTLLPSSDSNNDVSKSFLQWLRTYKPEVMRKAIAQLQLPEEEQVWTDKDSPDELNDPRKT